MTDVRKLILPLLLLAPLLSAGGSCEKGDQTGSIDVSQSASADPGATSATISTPAPKPDPADAVKFTIVYQNNLNGEIEPCG